MTKITPLDDRVVLKQLDAETVTKGGIHLPDQAQEKPQRGRVLCVGPGRVLDNGNITVPMVKKNDLVLFTKYAGMEVKLNGEELKIVRESDILAVLVETE